MAGEFDGRDDFDVALCGIVYYFGYFAVGVVSAVGGFFAGCRGLGAAPGLVFAVDAPRAYVVERGEVFYFDSPPGSSPTCQMNLVSL